MGKEKTEKKDKKEKTAKKEKKGKTDKKENKRKKDLAGDQDEEQAKDKNDEKDLSEAEGDRKMDRRLQRHKSGKELASGVAIEGPREGIAAEQQWEVVEPLPPPKASGSGAQAVRRCARTKHTAKAA